MSWPKAVAFYATALLWACTAACMATAAAANNNNNNNNAALQNSVLHFSYEIAKLLDSHYSPCEDFYAFVCSKTLNYSQQHVRSMQQWKQQKFDNFLSTPNNDEQLMDAELKLKHFYESCKNARSMEQYKATLLYRAIGGWPAIDDSPPMLRKRYNLTWLTVLAEFHNIGMPYFLHTRLDIISNKRIMHVEPNVVTHHSLLRYEQLTTELLRDVEPNRARLVALEVLSFERARRNVLSAQVNHTMQQEFTYEQFKNLKFGNATGLNWDAYMREAVGKPLKASDAVVVKQLPKLVQIFELLQNTTLTRLLNWINIDYLMLLLYNSPDSSLSSCQEQSKLRLGPIYNHIVAHSAMDKVQMAEMFANIGRAYDELLPQTNWVDEMSQRNSKQFMGRIMHMTLNGDAQLDADYQALLITKNNFYRNLEKLQRFQHENKKSQQRQRVAVSGGRKSSSISAAAEEIEVANEFMQIFLTLNSMLQQDNISTPLNYLLVGESFAEYMIEGAASHRVAGAWRSMDSEREFAQLEECLSKQATTSTTTDYNHNDLLLRMLAQQQSWHAFSQWLDREGQRVEQLELLLAAGKQPMSLRKLYFIGSLLADCRHNAVDAAAASAENPKHKQFVHAYLRNNPEFSQVFGCVATQNLYAKNVCQLLPRET